MMYKVKDHNNLRRDPKNQAIINVDREKLSEHRNKKQISNNIQHLNEEVISLKSDTAFPRLHRLWDCGRC